MKVDITAVINGHRENSLAVPSIRSLDIAAGLAEAAGLTVERLYVLDRPDAGTRSVFEHMCPPPWRALIVDEGDQGLARNRAADMAEGRYTAFLDGDDLWGKSWLVRAHAAAADLGAEAIVHPEFAYFFEEEAAILAHADQDADPFDFDLLRIVNYWDALCFCRTDIHRRHPYPARDIANGWAFEDWQWNRETLAAGYRHKFAPDTVIFKRRRVHSQTIEAGRTGAMPRRALLDSYACPIYRDRPGAAKPRPL